MSTDPLVKALLRERYGCNDWWPTPVAEELQDDSLTTAKRRRELLAEADAAQGEEEEIA